MSKNRRIFRSFESPLPCCEVRGDCCNVSIGVQNSMSGIKVLSRSGCGDFQSISRSCSSRRRRNNDQNEKHEAKEEFRRGTMKYATIDLYLSKIVWHLENCNDEHRGRNFRMPRQNRSIRRARPTALLSKDYREMLQKCPFESITVQVYVLLTVFRKWSFLFH